MVALTLAVPRKQAYSATGDGVVAKKTAEVVGHNGSGFRRKVAILKTRNMITNESWPADLELPPHSKDTIKVAPENWLVRYTVMRAKEGGAVSRYPPLNLVNALDQRPPREKTQKHIFTPTYDEPPFPIIRETCAHTAACDLHMQHEGKYAESVDLLQLYRAVRKAMGVFPGDEVDAFLQPKAKAASQVAVNAYRKFLRQNKERNKKRPARKKTAYQMFRADSAAKADMQGKLSDAVARGEEGLTLAKVSSAFWETASSEYKKPFEDMAEKDGVRFDRQYTEFLEWQKKHDEEREGQFH